MTDRDVLDVIVVGAGISGIGAGYHLQRDCPDRSYVILEGRDRLGGTWDLFRYPGVRSDSDMHTLGYSFKPWTEAKAIADGPSILRYLEDTAAEHGIDRKVRYRHLVRSAAWSSDSATWTLTVDVTADDGTRSEQTVEGRFLFMCSGYYSYKGGYTPEFAGRDDFRGEIVHPQEWPEDFDHAGKRIVVIGSGATAMTLVPAMADTAAHVTMLQRSPTYVVSRPDQDPIANALRKVLPDRLAYRATRWKNMRLGEWFYRQTRTRPDKIREKLLDGVRSGMPDVDVDTHFSPEYDPWDQRLCLIPNGDLYEAVNSGRASVVTDHIERFDADGVVLTSGARIDADVIVTATGLQLVTIGDMDAVTVDGREVDFSQTWTYKGLSYSGVPNLVSSFGYINASWTLRSDITCGYVTRLLNHLRDSRNDSATPMLRPEDADMVSRPFIDDFSAGYMARMMPMLPKQGDRAPWLNPQLLSADRALIAEAPVDDGVVQFSRATVPARTL